jgi:hypothetical protein
VGGHGTERARSIKVVGVVGVVGRQQLVQAAGGGEEILGRLQGMDKNNIW